MPVRLASPDEAEILWEIRNQAIRHGCKNTYGTDIVMAWTPDQMPPGCVRPLLRILFLWLKRTVWVRLRQRVIST